ncbi:MAG: hypothetical protein KF681_16645 [Bdellovibrionaceae bacterium]|nr:hypothetical protein [Pseudobdellovibrionaceae bacterium]
MMNRNVSTLLFAVVALASTGRAETFSVNAWSKDLQSSLGTHPTAVDRLLDVNAIVKRTLVQEKSAPRAAMNEARALYGKGQFEQALAKYNEVPRGSDLWLEAVEEKGWAYHREKDFEKALAQTKTLLSNPFLSIVGSEPFFLQSLSQLKICDYKGILETHKLFKESQRQRLVELQGLSETGKSEALAKLIEKNDQFPLSFENVGESVKSMPRLFYKDLKFQQAVLELKMAKAAIPVLENAKLNKKQKSVLTRLQKIAADGQARAEARLKELALRENDQNFKMLQKLNLIEVETIQRIHADREMDRESFRKGQFAKAGDDQLVFPDDGRPWIDELDKYQVKVNSCPQNIRRRM